MPNRWTAPQQIIQAIGGTVGGTAESARGAEYPLSGTDTLVLFIDYVAGTEGTLYIYPKFRREASGTAYAWQDWTATAGDKTTTANRLKLTASGSNYVVFDVTGQSFVQFYSLTAGAPTGALGLSMVCTGE